MSYYLRFVVDGGKDVDVDGLAASLRTRDPLYSLDWEGEIGHVEGELNYAGEIYCQISIDGTGEVLTEDIQELTDEISGGWSLSKMRVRKLLKRANQILCIQTLWQDRDTEATLSKIVPIWEYMFENHSGLMYAGAEGWYDRKGLILPVR